MMKKVLTEERLCELAGIQEADTVSLYKTQREKAKRARHNVEKDFFGSADDPLVTTDVPVDTPDADDGDPEATHRLDPVQLQKDIQDDVAPESRRPEAMKIYKQYIEPFYSDDELEILVGRNDDEIGDALSQIIGWFHPAFQDRRGRNLYDNPSRLGIKVAREFIEEDLDFIQDAQEFSDRVEKYMTAETKRQFAPSRRIQSQSLADEKALDAVLDDARKQPQFKDLPPHQHFTGAHHEKYAAQLRAAFPEVYQDRYEKVLDALMS